MFVGFHSLEDFLPLYHAYFTVHCLCRLHAFKSLSLVNDRRLDVFAAPSCDGIAAAAGYVFAVSGNMLSK